LIFIEVLIAPDNGKIVTSFFTRFSVIPNRLGENYYDFFLTHEPDYLRLQFSRLMKILGISSPYIDPPIARVIGYEYYQMVMGANTGLLGSAVLNFGKLGVFLEPVLIVLFLRLVDKVTIEIENNSSRFIIGVVMSTLLINAPSMLISAIIPISYMSWILISLALAASKSVNISNH
jgi:hypothetical protein